MPGPDAGILRIDHIVGNVELGKMDDWADWYSRVLGFKRYISFDDKDISTEYSALMSIVMSDDAYAIKFPINEPAAGRRKSQIDEYLRVLRRPRRAAHRAARGRHRSHRDRAARSRRRVPARAAELLRAAARARRRDRGGSRRRCKQLGILVDRDEDGYLLQIFTRRSRIGRRCSSRSSSGRAAAASARATSRRCSKRSSASRRSGNL